MVWRELYSWLEREQEMLPVKGIDFPDAVGPQLVPALEREELRIRPRVDAWIEARFLKLEFPPPPDDELAWWIGWRIHSATVWLMPLAYGPNPQEQVDYESWLRWLLITCWPTVGLHAFLQSAQAAAFQGLVSVPSPPRRPPIPPQQSAFAE